MQRGFVNVFSMEAIAAFQHQFQIGIDAFEITDGIQFGSLEIVVHKLAEGHGLKG
jgi:hypothetical protein